MKTEKSKVSIVYQDFPWRERDGSIRCEKFISWGFIAQDVFTKNLDSPNYGLDEKGQLFFGPSNISNVF